MSTPSAPAAEALRRESLQAWTDAGFDDGQVHVVSLKPLLAKFFEETLRDGQPNRAAADAVTHSLQKGRRHWSREDFAAWCLKTALPWAADGDARIEATELYERYEGISPLYDDDDAFDAMMRAVWHLE